VTPGGRRGRHNGRNNVTNKRLRLAAGLMTAVAAAGLATAGAAPPAGTWTTTSYPAQSATYETSVGQPINADGSSNFKANGKGVIPVKFDLKAGLGAFRFESIFSNTTTADDSSNVSFRPPAPLAVADLTTLAANYSYFEGNCGGGSLRWSVGLDADGNGTWDGSVFVYYGAYPNFTDCSGPLNQSGENLRLAPDLRVDTSQLTGGTFYDSWAGLTTQWPNALVTSASLVVDAGWNGDDRIALASATVNDTTFVPASASPSSSTCDLPAATIKVTKVSGASAGAVNEPVSIQPGDDNGALRVVDCHYAYNLAISSLAGVGRYKVEAVIGGVTAAGGAVFELR
jgi:hypothetical protein